MKNKKKFKKKSTTLINKYKKMKLITNDSNEIVKAIIGMESKFSQQKLTSKTGILRLDPHMYNPVIKSLLYEDSKCLNKNGYLNKTVLVFPNEKQKKIFYKTLLANYCPNDHNMYDNGIICGKFPCYNEMLTKTAKDIQFMFLNCSGFVYLTVNEYNKNFEFFKTFNVKVKRIIFIGSNFIGNIKGIINAENIWFDSYKRVYKSKIISMFLKECSKTLLESVIIDQLNVQELVKIIPYQEYFPKDGFPCIEQFKNINNSGGFENLLDKFDNNLHTERRNEVIKTYNEICQEQVECSICYSIMKDKNYALLSCCKNFICTLCFKKLSINGNIKCPYCKAHTLIDEHIIFLFSMKTIFETTIIRALLTLSGSKMVLFDTETDILPEFVSRKNTEFKTETNCKHIDYMYYSANSKFYNNIILVTDKKPDLQKLAYIMKKHNFYNQIISIDIKKFF